MQNLPTNSSKKTADGWGQKFAEVLNGWSLISVESFQILEVGNKHKGEI